MSVIDNRVLTPQTALSVRTNTFHCESELFVVISTAVTFGSAHHYTLGMITAQKRRVRGSSTANSAANSSLPREGKEKSIVGAQKDWSLVARRAVCDPTPRLRDSTTNRQQKGSFIARLQIYTQGEIWKATGCVEMSFKWRFTLSLIMTLDCCQVDSWSQNRPDCSK